MKLSVIIPMYNESRIIAANARTLSDFCRASFSDYEILFVDDGSTDGSAELVRALSLPDVRVLGYKVNRGKGCAVRTGMLAATGDFRLFTDADLAYGTEVIADALKRYEAAGPRPDLLIGSRKLAKDGYAGYTFMRRLASGVYLGLLRLLGGFRLSDSQVGFKGFSAKAAKSIFTLCETDRFAFDFEALCIASRLGLRTEEMPVRIINHGESKINLLRDSVKMFGDILKIRRRVRRAVPRNTAKNV